MLFTEWVNKNEIEENHVKRLSKDANIDCDGECENENDNSGGGSSSGDQSSKLAKGNKKMTQSLKYKLSNRLQSWSLDQDRKRVFGVNNLHKFSFSYQAQFKWKDRN